MNEGLKNKTNWWTQSVVFFNSHHLYFILCTGTLSLLLDLKDKLTAIFFNKVIKKKVYKLDSSLD